jgi:hypothetical protein
VFNFRSDEDAALAEWALNRFEMAGLGLPPLTIAFHDDKEPCRGHFGYFRASKTAQIDICGFNWDRFLVTPKRTILHELGHAYAHKVDEESRRSFVGFMGLEVWDDDRVPWEEQGSEHAAETIAWALMDEEIVLTSIGDPDSQTLAVAFELLTSSAPSLR